MAHESVQRSAGTAGKHSGKTLVETLRDWLVNLTLRRDSPVKVLWVDRVGDALSTDFWTCDKVVFLLSLI